VALRREGALARTGQAHGRAGCEWLRFPLPQTPRPGVSGTSSSLERTWLELRGGHSSSLRECFAIFSTRLCAMSHISDPKRIFFPPKSRCGNFFQPFPFGHPRYIRSL
jgi:hypothetical protein